MNTYQGISLRRYVIGSLSVLLLIYICWSLRTIRLNESSLSSFFEYSRNMKNSLINGSSCPNVTNSCPTNTQAVSCPKTTVCNCPSCKDSIVVIKPNKTDEFKYDELCYTFANKNTTKIKLFDDILTAKKKPVKGNSIFFIETTCARNGTVMLNERYGFLF